ncbi:M14 family metallopeptidase [Oleiharenicola sp. Vm1]|uniref:M14 family metallopeptidase n=1 Tax=Oleiharenicola sp. Vm1 TaxID=3398393 RepID=UPI0039F5D65D
MKTRLLSAALLAAPLALASSPSDFLPPAPAWHGASEALVAPPDSPWITPAEKTGLTDSPNYADTIAWLEKLAAASPRIKLVEFGRTAQGRPLYLVVASQEGAETAEALTANRRPTLLAQAGIHSGEIDGKDAGLMFLRDLAFGAQAPLLEKANFLFIPVFNADGHERSSERNRPNQRGPVHQGWRTTAQNLNLNRDYMKADAPEMRALLEVLNDWQPELYLDLHVTDGIDYQYDITFGHNGYGGQFAWSPQIGKWLDDVLDPLLDRALTAAGHQPGPLIFAQNNRDLAEGIGMGTTTPRFSNGYGDLRHIPSILVENHSLKPYKQRVLGTYVLLAAALRGLGDNAAGVRAAIDADSDTRPAKLAANFGVPRETDAKFDFAGIAFETYDSPASGTKEVRWLGTPKTYAGIPVHLDRNGATLARPKAFYVPVTKPELIERLRAHGIEMNELSEDTTVRVTLARLTGPKPSALPFEGHHTLKFDHLDWETRDEVYPAGSVRISTDQPLGDLAMMLLDPVSDESFLAWGFFPEILQRTEYIEGYVIAPLAEKMLADDPKLKAEFEAKLAAEPAFAKNPTARLQWFYRRSKFYDDRHLLYPVGLERDEDAPLSATAP